jgi:hypothetical protein
MALKTLRGRLIAEETWEKNNFTTKLQTITKLFNYMQFHCKIVHFHFFQFPNFDPLPFSQIFHFSRCSNVPNFPFFQLLHGFDNIGRLYNPDGKEENWWPRSLETKFKDKTKCFVSQYSNDKIAMDGGLTLAENIADNGGLMASIRG